jgi:squalene synthase HpnC
MASRDRHDRCYRDALPAREPDRASHATHQDKRRIIRFFSLATNRVPPASHIEHYENFPVASILLPKHLRRPIEVIYHFARSADDIADEGDADAASRLAGLQNYRDAIALIARGSRPDHPLFGRVADIIEAHALPPQLFDDLIDAFMQDVVKTRYADRAEVLDYCRRSANPVGRLLLHLYGRATAPALAQSDAICSALQLINFWQDVAIDWQKRRIYLPLADMARFGVTEQDLEAGKVTPALTALLADVVDWADDLLMSGAPLVRVLPGRASLELRMTVAGGATILRKLRHCRFDVFRARPTLRGADWWQVAWRALTLLR